MLHNRFFWQLLRLRVCLRHTHILHDTNICFTVPPQTPLPVSGSNQVRATLYAVHFPSVEYDAKRVWARDLQSVYVTWANCFDKLQSTLFAKGVKGTDQPTSANLDV